MFAAPGKYIQGRGAAVGYAHPSLEEFPDDWSTERFFAIPRSVEAREFVADAALGVVDSVDLVSPTNDEGAVFLYHRLLSCGLRLAAVAGLGAGLRPPRGPGLSVDAFKEITLARRKDQTHYRLP